MARTAARDVAFKLLFSETFGSDCGLEGIVALSQVALDADDSAYVENIVSGCLAGQADLDDAIAKHARGWEIDRLSRVDLCLLRLAAYEMLYREDIPASVSVNEAVELAHTYSSDEAPAFINGVLGALAREVGKE